MDDDLKAVVERVEAFVSHGEWTQLPSADLRTLLSALRQRDGALGPYMAPVGTHAAREGMENPAFYRVGEFIGNRPVLCEHGHISPDTLCPYCEGERPYPGRLAPAPSTTSTAEQVGTSEASAPVMLCNVCQRPVNAGHPSDWCTCQPYMAPAGTHAAPSPGEGAAPVAWRVVSPSGEEHGLFYHHGEAKANAQPGDTVKPLYGHPTPATPEGLREALTDLHTIAGWLDGLASCPDLNDVAADGGVTVGMCYQQEAREFAGRFRRVLAALAREARDE